MTSIDVQDRYALAPMQQGMLFHYLSSDDAGVDIEQIVCTLDEALNLDAFQRAWQGVAARHAVFRTRFVWEGLDEPVQEVLAAVERPWTLTDFRHVPKDEQPKALERFLREDRGRGFDLRTAPLMRVTVLQMAADRFIAVWTFNHIILDGRSFPLVLKEVFARYEALRDGGEAEIAPPRAYRDHITRLRALDLSGTEARAFWTARLAGFSAPTPLPGAEPLAIRLSEGEDDQDEREVRLSEAATSRLAELGRRHDVTMNNFIQGAWAVLLSRYSGEADVVFGAARAGRRGSVQGADEIVGHFINTVPVRLKVDAARSAIEWFKALRADQRDVWKYEQTPLVDMQSWSDISPGTGRHLFDTILVFDTFLLDSHLRAQGGSWLSRHFRLIEKTNFPLTLYGNAEPELILRLVFDRRRFRPQTVERLLGHLTHLLDELSGRPEARLGELSLLTADERRTMIETWNATAAPYPRDRCVHQLIEAQAARTPDAVAIAFEDRRLTYRQLDARANQLARHLVSRGVGAGDLVGICIERSPDMVVAMLGIMKAGGAYVPLDPAFPADRIAFMIEDSGARVILTQEPLRRRLLDRRDREVICVDADWPVIARGSDAQPDSPVGPDDLAYAIYTSGSTGRPKGVLVEHRNVVNFFTGMDERLPHDPPGVWLAVTSLSFDISVLELLYTLARGFKVVLYREPDRSAAASSPASSRPMDFSLFYFASDEGERAADKYKLLLEGARFADRNGFVAVSTPERHFHAFGGLYPNPAVAGAALASITERVQIRAGSVVMPLHHPVRVAEEWALVDNLSNGRVGISFASGWQPVDFIIRPDSYADRQRIMYEGIETVRKLWRGGKVAFPDADGKLHEVGTLPRPVQDELPVWITTAGSPDTWRSAGSIGANVLTHLLGQSIDDIRDKIGIYREARAAAGHDPATGRITLMLHTFVGDDIDDVRDVVRQPMKDYLGSALSLVKNVAHAWTAFKRRSDGTAATAGDVDLKSLSRQEMDDLLEFSFARYFETSGLFGTPESCLDMVDRLKAIGVDEIACLIDFGIDSDTVLAHLYQLNKLRKLANERVSAPEAGPRREYTIGGLISDHKVTHVQCTPSMASMILLDDDARAALGGVKTLMIGGEAFPPSLARDLRQAATADIINMYGPTETTIWSSTQPVSGDETSISIGRPIANTQFYILDTSGQPAPVGVAGELSIGGDGVVRGYHRRPELTAERFVPDPFRDDGARLYRTGDLARWLPDGRVEFLGRADHQVKIRGYRIELGEIESLLAADSAVREAVVVAREDSPGDVRLVAYVLPAAGGSINADDLRAMLRGKLPEYMVPAHYIALDAFPLTPNRKVDRKALPAPDKSRTVATAEVVAPTNAIEETIIGIWMDVLGIASAGIDDNFFDLGGHSLLAVKAHRRLTEAFTRPIAITDLFRYPTVRALAAFLGADAGADAVQKAEDRAETRREMMARRRQARARQRT